MKTLEEIKNRTIITTRIFNVDIETLYKAWSDPILLSKWWGPQGFTNTFHEFNFVEGGSWNFTMHGPDGNNYENKHVFTEITQPNKIVFDHIEPVHSFEVTALFEAVENNTRLTFTMVFDSADECQRVKPYVEVANEQNFDKLEALLASNS